MRVPWIRVHGAIITKPVTMRLAEALRVRPHEAVGYLVVFWGNVAAHASNGVVGDYPDAVLEQWAGWTRKRGTFASWLRASHLDADGRVNEWDEYAGKLEVIREQDRRRQGSRRLRKSAGNPRDDTVTPGGLPRDVTRESASTRTNEDEDGTEREITQPPPSAREPSGESGRAMLLEKLTASRRHGLEACLRMWEQGMELPPGIGIPTAEQVDRACREVMAGVDLGDIKPNVVRGYLVKAMRPDNAPLPRGGSSGSFADGLRAIREGSA